MEMLSLICVISLVGNVVILGLAVKLYSEATKTHIFTRGDNKKGI